MKISASFLAALPFAIQVSGCACIPDEGVKISSFGYDPNDSTAFIQKAFDSGARKLVLDRQSGPWVTLPLKMRSNTELIIEPGVELVAKRGEYKGLRDYLLELPYCTNVTIRGGAGSTLRMWKKDYQGPDYKHGEWRYALRIFHCENVLVEGLNIVESGGDGIGVTGKNITIRKCVCDRNHRQGISVFSAENLLIEDTILHEMIHYHIAVNQLRDTSAHGRLFRREMKRINAEGNRHITISYRLSKDQLLELYPEKNAQIEAYFLHKSKKSSNFAQN